MTLARQTSTESPAAVVAAWQHAYAQRLLITDFIVIVVSVYGSQFIRFGTSGEGLLIRGRAGRGLRAQLLARVRDPRARLDRRARPLRDPRPHHRRCGHHRVQAHRGCDDPRVRACWRSPPSCCSPRSDAATSSSPCRSGSRCCSSARWLWRKWLVRRRAAGEYSHRAMLMGERQKSVHVAKQMARDGSSGIVIVGAITEHGAGRPRARPRHPRARRLREPRPRVVETRAPTPSCSPAPTPSTRAACGSSAGSSRPRRRTSSSRRRSRMSRARASTPARSPASRSSRSTIPSSRVASTPRSARSTSSSRSSPSSCSARCSS